MALWKREKKEVEPVDAGQVQKSKKALKRSPSVAMEVKLLAIEALESSFPQVTWRRSSAWPRRC